jgi:hypothetical protein
MHGAMIKTIKICKKDLNNQTPSSAGKAKGCQGLKHFSFQAERMNIASSAVTAYEL